MFRFLMLAIFVFAVYVAPQSVYAQQTMDEEQYKEYSAPEEDEVKYEDEITGVEIIWKEDGSGVWEKIISTGESELRFGDRKDIRQAKKKASMRAKASIAKFLKERLKTSDVQDEMTKTMVKHNGKSETATRKSVEVLTEKIENSADAILKGVITLMQDINKKEKYVMVKLGMSRKTMRASDNLRNNMNRDLDTKKRINSNSSRSSQDGRQINRSRNYDNF